MIKDIFKINLHIKLFTIIAILAFCNSCGYHMGSLMHPQIKTIAIAPITNETKEPNVSAILRGALAEQFQFDGSLKLKTLSTADCIIYGRVIEIETEPVADYSIDAKQTFRSSEWRVRVTFEYQVIIPGRVKPLISKRQVIGSADYQIYVDQNTTRNRGIQQACREAAEQAVIYTTEAW